MTGRSRAVEVEKNRADLRESLNDRIAVEEPLEIRLGFETDGRRETRSVSITMRTPGDDEDLVTGFLLTEGILLRPDEVTEVQDLAG